MARSLFVGLFYDLGKMMCCCLCLDDPARPGVSFTRLTGSSGSSWATSQTAICKSSSLPKAWFGDKNSRSS